MSKFIFANFPFKEGEANVDTRRLWTTVSFFERRKSMEKVIRADLTTDTMEKIVLAEFDTAFGGYNGENIDRLITTEEAGGWEAKPEVREVSHTCDTKTLQFEFTKPRVAPSELQRLIDEERTNGWKLTNAGINKKTAKFAIQYVKRTIIDAAGRGINSEAIADADGEELILEPSLMLAEGN